MKMMMMMMMMISDEIKRRIGAAWATFGKYRDMLKRKIPMCLKRKITTRACKLP